MKGLVVCLGNNSKLLSSVTERWVYTAMKISFPFFLGSRNASKDRDRTEFNVAIPFCHPAESSAPRTVCGT